MKLAVVIISALLVTVLAKPATNKRRSFRGDERRILKKAFSVLHDVERREEDGSDFGSGSGVHSYPAGDASVCAEQEVFCKEWGVDSCVRRGRCDGYASCENGEDEANCEDFQCLEGTSNICMTGNLSHTCFPNSYVCDGWADCPEDHYDELACAEKTNCTDTGYDYQCPDENTCYFDWDVCDGVETCLGGFDEANCADVGHDDSGSGSSKRGLIKKQHSGSGSGSAERNYGSGSGSAKRNYGSGSGSAKRNYGSGSTSANRNFGSGSTLMNFGSGSGKRNVPSKRGEGCASNEWQCGNGECTMAEYVCDMYDGDCSDDTDEVDCDESKCNALEGRHWCKMLEGNEFRGETKCIDLGHRCDGETVCQDGSDEENCEAYTCPTGYEKCQGGDKANFCYRERHCRYLEQNGKREYGSGSGSGKRGLAMKASKKRMLTKEMKHLLDALKED